MLKGTAYQRSMDNFDKQFVNFLKSFPPLDGQDLINLLSDCPIFGGVFSCNNIPKTKQRPVAFVVNTQPSTKSGEHWQVILLREDGVGEFFDSFGRRPQVSAISSYLNTECDSYVYSKKHLQHLFAVSCGLYCVNFIRARQSGLTYNDVHDQFSKDLSYNELFIYSYGIGQVQRASDLWLHRLPRFQRKRELFRC